MRSTTSSATVACAAERRAALVWIDRDAASHAMISPNNARGWAAVCDYYAKWEADGTTQRIHNLLRAVAVSTAPARVQRASSVAALLGDC